MKLSLVSTALFGLIACSSAIPLRTTVDALVARSYYEPEIEALLARAYELADELAAREWYEDLAARGPYGNTNANMRHDAHAFIDDAYKKGAVHSASQPSHQTGTYHANGQFHLDRQQPTNVHGDHKVAVQLNKGYPSTIGQVVVNKDAHASARTVSANLKHSVNIGADVKAPYSKGPGHK